MSLKLFFLQPKYKVFISNVDLKVKFLSCFLTSLQEENFSGTDDEDNEDGDDNEVAKLSSMILEQISTSLRLLH